MGIDKKNMIRKNKLKFNFKKKNIDDMPKNVSLANASYRDKWKRIIDLAICVPICVLAVVPMTITAIAIKLDSPGSVLFRHKRLGLNGKEF